MPRFFNTTGACNPSDHYMLPAERRLPGMLTFVEQKLYFVLHAARQTGKTTAMLAFAERLRGQGYAAVRATLEESQGVQASEDAEPIWLSAIEHAAQLQLPAEHRPPPRQPFLASEQGVRLRQWLSAWSTQIAPVRVVLLLDEADIVRGPAMVSLLRQLRAGYDSRPNGFPTSIALIGMRDLRDYITQSKDGVPVNPGPPPSRLAGEQEGPANSAAALCGPLARSARAAESATPYGVPFNIKAASLTLRNFTQEEVAELYNQHTADTGQRFDAAAMERAFWWTQGQPFLVNALANITVRELVTDPAQTITAEHIETAKERLILSRTTHLDSLAQRLKEGRVRPIVQAVVIGDMPTSIPYDHDDFQYVLDLGLLRRGPLGAEAANPLYREVLARQLSYNLQESLNQPQWPWRTQEGRLDFPALIDAFFQWWRENADFLVQDVPDYPEAIPHLAFMAFLQRVVNGGGSVMREYAAGRGALDLLITYGPDRFVVEIKRVRTRDTLKSVREAAIRQTLRYLDTVGLNEARVLIFDQHTDRAWRYKLWKKTVTIDGRTLHMRGG